MEKRSLGSSGLQATVVGLGCNNFGMKLDLEASRRVIDACLDAGINFFDTADMYGGGKSEEFLGQVLGARRKNVLVATKFGAAAMMKKTGEKWGSRAYVFQSVDASLRRLGMDSIDLYQIHFPDPATPIEETLRALGDLTKEGKIRATGCSNFSGAAIDEATARAKELGVPPFVTAQNEWSLLARGGERDVIPACGRHGLGQLPYFPLASGLLTGKYRRGEAFPEGTRMATFEFLRKSATDENFGKVERLERFAKSRGRTLLELAISWLAVQPSVASVIAGATTPEQVRANVAAVGWRLSAEELTEIDRLAPA